jgi:hypothetical protein
VVPGHTDWRSVRRALLVCGKQVLVPLAVALDAPVAEQGVWREVVVVFDTALDYLTGLLPGRVVGGDVQRLEQRPGLEGYL